MKMKDVVERSREIIDTTLNRMEKSDNDVKINVKGDNIPETMLSYVTTLEDSQYEIKPQEICDYIDLLYENDREYNLYMLKNELEDKYMFREAYVYEATTYILKNQEINDNKEYTVKEIKDIFENAFEGKEKVMEAEMDL